MAVCGSDLMADTTTAPKALIELPIRTLLDTCGVWAERNPSIVYLARLASPASRRVMGATLADIARMLSGGKCAAHDLPWPALRYPHTNRLRALLIEQERAPATANRYLAALRGVLREAWRLGLMSAEDYQRAADLRPITGERLPRGRSLTPGEIRALFDACTEDKTPAGVRDAALLAVLIAGGLRRTEAAMLDVADYERETGELRVRSGKGRKERIAFIMNGAAEAVDDWLAVRGVEPGPLFAPVNKGGRIVPRRMTDQSVYGALEKRRAAAGVRVFSPHDCRRTFISELLDAGADLVTVQRMAGHASPRTTARYDRRGTAAQKKAATLLHVPYTRRTSPPRPKLS
jgi:integrase